MEYPFFARYEMHQEPSLVASGLDRHVLATPDTCGGRPRIAGSRIQVQDIVIWHERLGLSADEIVQRYAQLSLSDVYAALAYYYDHRSEVDEQMRAGDAVVEAARAEYASKLPHVRGV